MAKAQPIWGSHSIIAKFRGVVRNHQVPVPDFLKRLHAGEHIAIAGIVRHFEVLVIRHFHADIAEVDVIDTVARPEVTESPRLRPRPFR